MQHRVTVVGGGLAGLTAAITAAEAGAKVTLYAHKAAATNLRVSTARAREELGWRPMHHGSTEGLRALAAAER